MSLAKHLNKKYEVHIITKKSDSVYPKLGNIIVHYIEGFGSGNINVLKALPKLKETIDMINPSVVHFHCFMSLFLYSSIIEESKYKVIVTVHSTPNGKDKLFSWFDGLDNQKSFISIMYNKLKCDVTLFGSQYYMDEYVKHVPDMKRVSKCYVNPYYSDIKSIPVSYRDKKKNGGKVRILFPSRIVKRKGIEETLELLKLLPDNYVLDLPAMPQMEYQEYNNVILKKIDEMGLNDRVFYPSTKVIGTEMYEYYKKADITFIPSYFEGFGIVAVEALATSSLVFSTCTGGLKEIIEDGINGIQISLDDLSSVRDKILDVMNDKKLKHKLLVNGKKILKNKYSKKRHMDLIDEIYRDLVGE